MTSRVLAAVALLAGIAGCGAEPDVIPVASQCGATLDFTPVNQYAGDFAAVVEAREDAVVLINGNCTGTLIAAAAGPIILTAGHCVGLGDQALLAFNVEDAPDGDELVTDGTVVEQSLGPDYALIRPDALPAVTPTPLAARPTSTLVIIQHPRGAPKAVAEGKYTGSCHGFINYVDLDTLVGSSGAGILDRDGRIVGVHTDGDCDTDGTGSNFGWDTPIVVEASAYLTPADLIDL